MNASAVCPRDRRIDRRIQNPHCCPDHSIGSGAAVYSCPHAATGLVCPLTVGPGSVCLSRSGAPLPGSRPHTQSSGSAARNDPTHLGLPTPTTSSWKHLQQPYDLMVYELADATPYAFVWPYLVRHPGLVILHDGRLHDSRGGSLLRQVRVDDYRAEFEYNHPQASSDVPRLAHAELLGLTRELWSMRRVVLESSRLLLAPHPWIAEELRQEASHDRIGVLEPAVRRAPLLG